MSWELSLEELAIATHAKILSEFKNKFTGVGTDTRKSLRGQIFFALKGENFDAHDFLEVAVLQGASVLVVSQLPEKAKLLLKKVSIVEVPDVMRAMQNLALFWRHSMSAKILAVTGTNGKTTTKEYAATILEHKFKTQCSKGSFNNHWGVPLSLLSIEPQHEVAVIEMGMNHPGEISELVGMSDPDEVLVTMVGRGHLEGLGSVEEVARAKEEMYNFADPGVCAIFNIENEYTRKMYLNYLKAHPSKASSPNKSSKKLILFSSQLDAFTVSHRPDIHFELISFEIAKLKIKGWINDVQGEVEVPVFGEHNIHNLMGASALALSAGMTPDEIWKALPSCKTAWGRSQWMNVKSGSLVLFDAYNANPESMKAAIENFSKLRVRGRKIAFLGEMREMGAAAPEVHRELGALIGAKDFSHIFFVGPSAADFERGVRSTKFNNNLLVTDTYKKNLALGVQPVLDRDDVVLIKASRGMELERILEELEPVKT